MVPDATLGARTKFALEWLLTTTRLSKIHDAVVELGKQWRVPAVMHSILQYLFLVCCLADISTRQSRECCVQLVDEGGLQVLFGVLARCNRSIPNQFIIAKTSSILLNVAKVHS